VRKAAADNGGKLKLPSAKGKDRPTFADGSSMGTWWHTTTGVRGCIAKVQAYPEPRALAL
jgi:hypothetical protein